MFLCFCHRFTVTRVVSGVGIAADEGRAGDGDHEVCPGAGKANQPVGPVQQVCPRHSRHRHGRLGVDKPYSHQ